MERPERVLFINTICGTGSTGRLVTGLMDSLETRGIDSMCAYGRWEAPEKYKSYRVGNNVDVIVHGVLSRVTDRHALYSNAATRKLIDEIKKYDPDIIHLHNVHGYYLNFKILFNYLKSCGKRIVWTLHDCWTFTGHCSHYEYIGCDKWLEGCSHCPQKDQYPKTMLLDASKSNYELKKKMFTGIENLTIVTPSKWLAGEVGKSFLKEYPVVVVPTGINLNRFRPVESDIRDQYEIGTRKLILGIANPWRERKGYNDFIKLAEMLDDDYRIVMIGLKKNQLGALPDNIIGLEKTDSIEDIVKWYTAADVYVNLTYEDTFPTTNIESMACGTPVITYRAGGSPESVNSRTGAIVEKNDLAAVRKAIDDVTDRNDQRVREFCLGKAKDYSAAKRYEEYMTKVYGLKRVY
ncbi:MAG: glycosyltransferase [Lachnospiraceae bacterium]|nr:glycosyltransferase [Lachnospiraceae bacterium]